MPVDTALVAAERLAQAYREHLTALASAHGASASISAAIVYANVSAPLQVLLQRAHRLLDDIAKEQFGPGRLCRRGLEVERSNYDDRAPLAVAG